ncbi:unnamed protein product [Durusdinium trenchii]|uniref:Fungal lipase-type domain-containing protein n=1 Tax=Durusdinium trenchii TaxID=1381693 RepID=A0ABP0LVD6_9DINO
MEAQLEQETSTPRPQSRHCFRCTRRRFRIALAVAILLLCAAVGYAVSLALKGQPVHYSEEVAVRMAQLAGAAYCSPSSLKAWSCGSKCLTSVSMPKVCIGTTTQAFVAKFEGDGIISFEGTKSYMSMVQDLRIWKNLTDWHTGGKVHEGFLTEWESLRSCVMDALVTIGFPKGSGIRVTGHSLGGAVSVLAMVRRPHKDSVDARHISPAHRPHKLHSYKVDLDSGWHVREAYTFGMPRAGDAIFARRFDRKFFQRFFRVTHHMDPVPHVPPEDFGYQHLASEVFYDGNLGGGFRQCEEAEDEMCSAKYWDLPHDLFHIEDHKDYMDQQTGSEGCEGRAWRVK